MIDSFIKNIVRQSLNENYGLLNEGSDSKCPPSAFCLNDGSLLRAQKLSETLSPVGNGTVGQELINTLKFNCNRLNYGPANENLAISVVEIIGLQYSNTNVDENKVKREILKLNYPEWCMAIELAQQKGFADGDNFWNIKSVGEGDYGVYVANPSLQVLRNTIIKSDKLKKDYDEKRSTDKTKWDEELKKSGWKNRDEWKAAGWKPKPKEFTIGGGGEGTVNFTDYECISQHPAVNKTEIKIPATQNAGGGIGYNLDVNNPQIKKFIYGVVKRSEDKDSTDMGALHDPIQKITLEIDCTYKFLQHSLSTTPWNYNGVIDNNGKIALTTDPKYNNNIQIESIKGFRHNLLTEDNGKTKEEYPDCVQNLGDVVPDAKYPHIIDSKKNKYYTNNRATLQPGVQGNPSNRIETTVDYFCDSDGTFKFGKAPAVPSATEWRRDLKIGSVGVDVEAIQTKLKIPTKGGYQVGTENAVKSFQTKYNILPVTGIVDKITFNKIMSMDAVGTADTYSGQKHNYIVGDWIKITPNDNDNQFSANNGYFRITKIVDSYTVVIGAPLVVSGTTGGSTQRVLFGEDAKKGTQEVIKGDRNNSGTRSKGRTRSKVRTSTGNDVETKRREIRNSEYCDSLRKIKKHLNLKVDCKKYQSTLNKIMLALTGGVEIKPVTPVAPVSPVAPVAPITPSGNVTIY